MENVGSNLMFAQSMMNTKQQFVPIHAQQSSNVQPSTTLLLQHPTSAEWRVTEPEATMSDHAKPVWTLMLTITSMVPATLLHLFAKKKSSA